MISTLSTSQAFAPSNSPASPPFATEEYLSPSTASTPPSIATLSSDSTAPSSAGFSSQSSLALKPVNPALGRTTLAAHLATVNKMAALASGVQDAPGPLSVTSKEWVIPPRPKPGRKPATDTPPTKRKAQNRAAQRAFRERRAARVGELEEQLDEQKADHDRVERELRDRIQGLEVEAQTLRTRCQVLENMLERERLGRSSTGGQVEEPARPRNTSQPRLSFSSQQQQQGAVGLTQPSLGRYSFEGGSNISALQEGQPAAAQSFPISQIISPPDTGDASGIGCGSCKPDGPCACADMALASATLGCGNCSLGTTCECLREAISGVGTIPAAELKRSRRPTSPSSGPDGKRQRQDSQLETDFTLLFSQKSRNPSTSATASRHRTPNLYTPLPSQQVQHLPQTPQAMPPRDKCGFCEEGTYCVCADQSAVAALSQQTQTPPPSETDCVPPPMEVTATGAIKLPSLQKAQQFHSRDSSVTGGTTSRSCGPGGPGTCAQCLSDPKSGLFCRSLAANFERLGRSDGRGCCGGGGEGGCCRSNNNTEAPTVAANNKPKGLGLSLSCADTYKTLASHRHFDAAADEIASWLPMLKAAPPRPEPEATPSSRHPMEVEAASIMSVLKGFDVRFGK